MNSYNVPLGIAKRDVATDMVQRLNERQDGNRGQKVDAPDKRERAVSRETQE